MATPSQIPASRGSGNTKYALIGLLLLAAAGAIWFIAGDGCQQKEAAPAAPVDAGVAERPSALAETEMELPEEETDAGPPAEEPRPTKKRVITRYVAGDWNCSGDIPAAQVREVMAEHRRQVRACYERGLKGNNALQGTLSLMLQVGAQGQVVGTRIGGSLGSNVVSECVRSLSSRWRFPPPSGGTCAVVQVPFNLTPQTD